MQDIDENTAKIHSSRGISHLKLRPTKYEEHEQDITKTFDGYILGELEKMDHEKVLLNLDKKVQLKAHAHYHVPGVGDVVSAMYSSYRKILMCGWRNNKVQTIIFDQDKPELSVVVSNRYYFQCATHNNWIIGADEETQLIMIHDLKVPETPIHVFKERYKRNFLKDFNNFSRIFLIYKNHLLFHTENHTICLVDLKDVNFKIQNSPTKDVVHFALLKNVLFTISSSRIISKFHITEEGISSPFKVSGPIEGGSSYEFHTICPTLDNLLLVAGTSPSSFSSHNVIYLLNQDLKRISKTSLSRGGGLEYLPTNPIQTLKCTQKKMVNYVIASSAHHHIHVVTIIKKELKLLIKLQKLTTGRINGVNILSQSTDKILVFGYDILSDYII